MVVLKRNVQTRIALEAVKEVDIEALANATETTVWTMENVLFRGVVMELANIAVVMT